MYNCIIQCSDLCMLLGLTMAYDVNSFIAGASYMEVYCLEWCKYECTISTSKFCGLSIPFKNADENKYRI